MAEFDTILVLGTGIGPAGELPRSARQRVAYAAELYHGRKAPRLILSGRWPESFDYEPPMTEAEAMQLQAVNLGVPANAISLEIRSTSVIENVVYTKQMILAPNGIRRILHVTHEVLAARAMTDLQHLLGPEYFVQIALIDPMYDSSTMERLALLEVEKLRSRQLLYSNIEPGDHQAVLREYKNQRRTR